MFLFVCLENFNFLRTDKNPQYHYYLDSMENDLQMKLYYINKQRSWPHFALIQKKKTEKRRKKGENIIMFYEI